MSQQIEIYIDGKSVLVPPGQPVSKVLNDLNVRVLWHTSKHKGPRGVFCGMGVCFGCLVTINDRPLIRACLTPVEAGMHIDTLNLWPAEENGT